ncbi:hypothetical protein X975_17312, partial [Stegodyphus mimosarum]
TKTTTQDHYIFFFFFASAVSVHAAIVSILLFLKFLFRCNNNLRTSRDELRSRLQNQSGESVPAILSARIVRFVHVANVVGSRALLSRTG